MKEVWKVLEFDRILTTLSTCAVSAEAQAALLALTPSADEVQCLHRMAETTEARRMLEQCGTPPFSLMENLTQHIALAQAGGMLTPEQLTGVARFAASCRRLTQYLRRGVDASPMLSAYAGELHDVSALAEAIDAAVQEDRLRDEASAELRSIRRKIVEQEAALKEKLNRLLKTQKAYLADSYLTQRQGRWVLPVQRRYQQQFPGTVIEASGKGGTVFMEPAAASALQAELDMLRLAEDEETRRILYMLSDQVAAAGEDLLRNSRVMVELDVLFAKAKTSAALHGEAVELTCERRLDLRGARHPLLPSETCVPLDIALTGDQRGIIITGPNTGGKTVVLKTVGLFCLMAQCGLHVPCAAGSVLPLVDAVYCDIGDSQSLTQNLSTFSGHLTRVMEALNSASRDSLVLLDELGSGTDPAEGMGVAIAVLEKLRRRGCLFLSTTHDPQVKRYAEEAAHIVNGRMAFDRQSLKPLYRLELGKSGESCALFIAERMGFPPALLEAARAAAYMGDWQRHEAPPRLPVPRSALQRRVMKSAAMQPQFTRGDSVQLLPNKEIGIVYRPADDRGELIVQVQGQKLRVNAKRVRLLVPASSLYPDNYDFSIIFDTVANRKAAHVLSRKHDPNVKIIHEDGE